MVGDVLPFVMLRLDYWPWTILRLPDCGFGNQAAVVGGNCRSSSWACCFHAWQHFLPKIERAVISLETLTISAATGDALVFRTSDTCESHLAG